MTDTTGIALIERRIRKLQEAKDMLADPEIYELMRSIFADSAKAAPVAGFQGAQLELPRPRRKYKRRGGSLLDETFSRLREYGEPTTAKELAEFMQASGYRFRARDKNIAVSKVLRQLAGMGKIQSKRGEHAKAPIRYWVNVEEPDLKSVTQFRDIPIPGEDRPH
jgi:hypothetical protein